MRVLLLGAALGLAACGGSPAAATPAPSAAAPVTTTAAETAELTMEARGLI